MYRHVALTGTFIVRILFSRENNARGGCKKRGFALY